MYKIELWKDKEKKVVDPSLFSQKAEELAKELGGKGRNINKGTQLRRFFDEVVRFNDMAKGEMDMEMILPGLHMIIAKAAYAEGRNLVCSGFVTMIRSGIDQIESKKDLQVFTNFFESLIAFYKLHKPD